MNTKRNEIVYEQENRMSSLTDLISARRENVLQAYRSAEAQNRLRFLEGDDKATEEYIFPNQKEDANNIVDMLYKEKRRVISIQKKVKVGADGLMIEIAKLLTTHNDDAFAVNPDNVRFITGMSNVEWEKDMIDKAPACFKGKIFHHGKLSKAELNELRNGLIIIDEIDTGDKEAQVLHNTLKEAGVLDVKHMEEHNNRFIFISATLLKELYELYRWGPLHGLYKMTIPASYFGHKDFLERGILQDFYSLSSSENAEKWVQEDILDNYGKDFRVHVVRVKGKSVNTVQNACIRKSVTFRNHTSTDRLTKEEVKEFFKEPLTKHIVLGVKGFWRRANLLPNSWKLRIGATHEYYTKVVDNNVQIQGLPGRMSGYWRKDIEGGHKTGPHRTSIKAVEEYEKTYNDPFGTNSYQTAGFKKKKGVVKSDSIMLSVKNIQNLQPIDLPLVQEEIVDINTYRIYLDFTTLENVFRIVGYSKPLKSNKNKSGFEITSHHGKASVMSLAQAVKNIPKTYGLEKKEGEKEGRGRRLYWPCYVDISDKSTIRYVLIIHPDVDKTKIQDVDTRYPSVPYRT
jgi:hypothetical protein